MSRTAKTKHCFNCGHTEDEIPLLALQFQGHDLKICPQCLPLLIHAPQKLAGKLAGAEKLKGSPHSHH